MSTNFIFLHGGGQGSWVWHDTIEAMKTLAGETLGQILALDIPGCGTKRGQVTEDFSVNDIVTNLLDDIETAGISKSVLVGHSQAGTILPLLIKARPKLFQHTFYVSCLAPIGNQTAISWRTQMPEADSAVLNNAPPGSRDFYRQMFCNDMTPDVAEGFLDKLGPDQWPAASYQMSGWDYDHLAGHSSSYILCKRDQALLPTWQEMFAERLEARDILPIDAGHQVMNTQPRKLAQLILPI